MSTINVDFAVHPKMYRFVSSCVFNKLPFLHPSTLPPHKILSFSFLFALYLSKYCQMLRVHLCATLRFASLRVLYKYACEIAFTSHFVIACAHTCAHTQTLLPNVKVESMRVYFF